VLLFQHPVLVLVFNQSHCGCLIRSLGQETALWTTICSVSGFWSPAAYCQQAAAAGFIYWSSLGGTVTSSYSCRPCLFRVLPGTCHSPRSYKPAAVAGSFPKFAWGAALPQFSSGVSCMSATVATFVHLEFTVGSPQTHLLWPAYLFKVCVGASPFLQSTQGAPPSFLCVLFSSLFFYSVFFFPREGVRLSRGLC
jgi:hypothetical protein